MDEGPLLSQIRKVFLKFNTEVNRLIDSGSILTFIIIAFSLAVIIIMKRESLPPHMKRPLALLAIIMVSFAFFLIVYSFLH